MLELAAWNNWKEKCAVEACDNEYQKILEPFIAKKFRALANHISSESKCCHRMRNKDICHEFDTALIVTSTGGKIWKEAIWDTVEKSTDPKLQVIHGKLTGPRGVMISIVRNYIKSNYSIKVTSENKIFVPLVSLDDTEDGQEAMLDKLTRIYSGQEITLSDRDECKAIVQQFEAPEQQALLLILLMGKTGKNKALTNQEVLNSLGFEKSTAYTRLKDVQKIASSEQQRDFWYDAAKNESIIKHLRSVLQELLGAPIYHLRFARLIQLSNQYKVEEESLS